ncbi:Ribonuclease [Candidatus Xiphinematobacter sp. Idaho Grape]|uniref:MBL fold metallo-hydrolase n=1 Tax=Candidatus Xiphinematobacter sp. Idaho Grape TaxID=1704307 RepID=UPI000705E090|nr:MBL fold metallo-hydrolase [Candidatus Xiphinematobacter sp. Idaho Grape]ALJ57003.1 Ribonuclease [Candidatus Xiphinematobacter sp. Idaho Grape]
MQLTNLTRNLEIGANSYLLKAGGNSILLDAGFHPRKEGRAALPNFSLLEEENLDVVVLTHAHHDHIGALPALTKRYRDIPVYMTPATARVAGIMLHNSVNVMMRRREAANLPEYPLFTHRGVDRCSETWQLQPIGHTFYPCSFFGREIQDVRVCFFDAGHVLGSAGVLVESEGRTFFYTGDVNFSDQSFLRGANFPEEGIDILMMEATRGDSPMEKNFTRAAEELRLAQAIKEIFERGGTVTIPVFSLGKTQELLAMFWKMRVYGLLPAVPIYISGLSAKLTVVYDAFSSSICRHSPALQLLQEMTPRVVNGAEIRACCLTQQSIFALSSGMMSENTLSNIFARRILESPRQGLFFVGHTDADSPAGKIRRTIIDQEVVLEVGLPTLKRKCQCKEFNFSAHSSREALLAYALRIRPKTIVLAHGDPMALEWFRVSLTQALPKTRIILPQPGQAVDL